MIAYVFHTTTCFRPKSVSFGIAESIRLKVILMGRMTPLPLIEKLSDPNNLQFRQKKNQLSDVRLTRIYLVHIISKFRSPNLTLYCHQLCTDGISIRQNLTIALGCFLMSGIFE